MHAAQHLYAEAGFKRLPQRDYEYAPGHRLLAFGMPLTQAKGQGHVVKGWVGSSRCRC